ncbi:unnamed protein product [marine sediment metagenome]|uniref:4Fe-4S ferredoxin-type domain-containing protein n=1 Tax=marine sediment metagenome TaxID=412755 RepID=X1S9V3_9ZZZZ
MLGLKYLKNVSTLKLEENRCNGCGMCAVVCPHNVFAIEDKKAVIKDIDLCMECGACELNCPTEAIAVKSGVGCAAAVISSAVKGTGGPCDCGYDSDDSKASGCC